MWIALHSIAMEMSYPSPAIYTLCLEVTGLISEGLHLSSLCCTFKVVASSHVLLLQAKKLSSWRWRLKNGSHLHVCLHSRLKDRYGFTFRWHRLLVKSSQLGQLWLSSCAALCCSGCHICTSATEHLSLCICCYIFLLACKSKTWSPACDCADFKEF